jgi:hypothetical protein
MSGRKEVSEVLQKEMKPGVGVSLCELMKISAVSKFKQNIVYFTLKDLAKAKMVDYSEKRGRERLFKMVDGADFAKCEFKKRGRVKAAVEPKAVEASEVK